MSRQRSTVASFWFGLLLACSITGQSEADDASSYERQLQRLKSSIAVLQKQLSGVLGQRDKLLTELQTAETEIGQLHADIRRLGSELQAQRQQLQSLQQRKQALLQSLRDQQQAIVQQVSSAYRLGKQSQLKLLLNLEDPNQWARQAAYHRYLLAARADKIGQYLATVEEIDSLSPRIETEAQALQASQDRLQRRHESLAATQAERKKTVALLEKDIQSKDQQLQSQQQDHQRLQKLLEEVTRALAELAAPDGGKPFQQQRGKMSLPAKGKIVKKFGQARVAGKLNWEGVLIEADIGTEVSAIHGGRVVFSDYLRGHGLLLIIDHGDGYMSLYAHNQSLLRETGQWVSAGEVIARVGNSGGQSRSALYFEIRHQGKPTDPARWCRGA